ncbi:sigma-54 dependent transcriptional regulator [Caballeronia sp. dw_276]|uniref:sigma-54-dependent transcriptional regulator n=1 Tax=Caballeronia sp. dw_276 TaxID=2719795 RepID=UPI001BD2AADD|nr:sigma-54 dependent transcriptional regulator [Caballeronia sp. dw_276]
MTIDSLTVLFVEDDDDVRKGSVQAFELNGLKVQPFSRAESVLPRITFGFPGIVVTDLRLPGMDGISLLKQIKQIDETIPVIVITGHGDISIAVDTMRQGAYDFIAKPFSSDYLIEVTRRALEKRYLTLELATLKNALKHRDQIESRILGQSRAIVDLRRMILELADTDASVLILGDTGTGKELVARSLHDFGLRKSNNFAAINCAGIPEMLFESEVLGHEAGSFTGAIKRRIGKIEYAKNGTLFLDEVETMQRSLQAKLLRILQERSFERVGSNEAIPMECRIIAGTKSNLLELSQDGDFRDDLYYRLGVVTLEIPPLRDRREDIPVLFEHFVLQAALSYNRPAPDVPQALIRELMSRPWLGNVRELRNFAERFSLGMLNRADVPNGEQSIREELSLEAQLNGFERYLIEYALRTCMGRASLASEQLSIPKKTLYDKMRRLGIDTNEFKIASPEKQ